MKAIILLSGGLDSTLVLAKALENKKQCIALSFDYGQRHKLELEAAKKIAEHYSVEHKIIKIDPDFLKNGSTLTSNNSIPENRSLVEIKDSGIPSTYVPGRNMLFLSYAHSLAEMTDASEIHFGANSMDYSGYPDCRPVFFEVFNELFCFSSKRAVEGNPPKIMLPLLYFNKKQIVAEAKRLSVPIELTFSCYNPNEGFPCNICDACVIRKDALQ